MYALYLAGPIAERWYGSLRFLLFYLACAAAGSVGSFVFGGDVPSVGASGAIFGLFGVLLAAGRVHHPVDRQSRAHRRPARDAHPHQHRRSASPSAGIDNAAHLGGLAAGLFLGRARPADARPDHVVAVAAAATEAGQRHVARVPMVVLAAALAVVFGVVAVGLFVGTQQRIG